MFEPEPSLDLDTAHLEAERHGPSGAELLVPEGTESAPRRCWLLLRRQRPSLCPAGSSPDPNRTRQNQTHAHTHLTQVRHHGYLLRRTPHSSDRTRQSGWSLRHRSSCRNAATCRSAHTRTSGHASQGDPGDPRLRRGQRSD